MTRVTADSWPAEEIFNQYFASQCTTSSDVDSPPMPEFSYLTETRLTEIKFDEEDVFKVLLSR